MKKLLKLLFVLAVVAIIYFAYFAYTNDFQLPHSHTWVDATCTTPQTCSVCKETKGEALGHTEVIDAGVEATCTSTGLTEGKHCSVCNEIIVVQNVIGYNHTEVIDASVEATCTSTGLTEGRYCSLCNETIVAQQEIPAKGHSWDNGIITIPKADALAEKISACSVCGETNSEEIPDLTVFTFEAEDALVNGDSALYNSEFPDYGTPSGGQCIGKLSAGDKVTYNITSDYEGVAKLYIYINTVDSKNFEELYTLTVNGASVVVGDFEGVGWNGANAYYEFSKGIEVEIQLVEGENVIEFTVTGNDHHTNFDCIKIKVDEITTDEDKSDISGAGEFTFEAENALVNGGQGHIDTPDYGTPSGGLSLGSLATGDKVTYNFTSD